MADQTVAFEHLEVAVDRRLVERQRSREVAGRDRAVGREQRLDHQSAWGRQAQPRGAQRVDRLIGTRDRQPRRRRARSSPARRPGCSRCALQRSSIRPNRHTDSAIAQVATNIPTITKPSTLMSMFSNQFQNEPDRLSSDGEQAAELDRPDHERDGDRQARDRDVVEDLADRLRERPAVGEVHERAVDRVHQRHPGGEQDRQAQDRVPRQPGARRRRRRSRAARPRSRCRTRGRTARRSGTSAGAW